MSIRVLIADGQPLLSECLALALERFDDLVPLTDREPTGPDAVEAMHRHQPDVALLDYWMPGIGGPESSGEVLSQLAGYKVIFLSWFYASRPWYDAPGDIERALAAGAVGFLPKHVRVEVVADAVRQAHAGANPVFPDGLEELLVRMRKHRREAGAMWQELAKLTPREIEIIELLATGMTVQDAAAALLVTTTTVRTHVQRILQKTQTHSQGAAIATARNYGLIQV